jgi:hypothetical protein
MEQAMQENLKEWLENPYWAAYYNEAPSELCKQYVANELFASDTEDESAFAEMDRIFPKLTVEDLRHLLKYSASGPGRGQILKRIEELER